MSELCFNVKTTSCEGSLSKTLKVIVLYVLYVHIESTTYENKQKNIAKSRQHIMLSAIRSEGL